MAMGMIQLVEKNLSPPRDGAWASNCSQVAGEGRWGSSGVLLGVGDEGGAVEHEHPASVVAHDHGDRCGCGFDAGAGGGVVELGLDEGGWGFHHVHASWSAGVFCCSGVCVEGISMPGMSGMGGCLRLRKEGKRNQ